MEYAKEGNIREMIVRNNIKKVIVSEEEALKIFA